MAIAYDTSGGFGVTNGGGTVDLTLGASATILVASVYYNSAGAVTPTATWNGDAMTSLGAVDLQDEEGAGSGLQNWLFYILNPDTGTHTLSITDSASRPLGFSAASYSGVDSVGTPSLIGSTTAGTLTHTITTGTGGWLVMGGTGNDPMAAGTGFTARNTQNSFQVAIGDSNDTLTPGSNTISLTNASNNGISSVAVELIPPASGLANLKTWNGVAKANIKTINGVAIASVKTYNGVA